MSAPTPIRLHHLALTVTDLDASVRWYESVFNVQFVMDAPHNGGVGKILADPGRHLMFALHRHDTNDGQLFAETITGLDHAGFNLPGRGDLQMWQDHLEVNLPDPFSGHRDLRVWHVHGPPKPVLK